MKGVAPREGRVSRNGFFLVFVALAIVAPREGRVSRNNSPLIIDSVSLSRAPRGACE